MRAQCGQCCPCRDISWSYCVIDGPAEEKFDFELDWIHKSCLLTAANNC